MPRARRLYPSDLTDEEWALLEPLLASSEKRGRSAEVACPTRRRRRLLFAEKRLRLAHAAPGVSALANGLLPLLEVAPRRAIAPSPQPAPRSGARGRRARARPGRCGDRQPGRQRDRGGRTGTRLRRGQAALGQEAPPAGGHHRARARRARPRRQPARSGRRAKAPDQRVEKGAAADGAALGRRSCSGPTEPTRGVFASGPRKNGDGGWRCPTTRTGGCGATG